mmetsp:Transcript_82140/g.238149  ORF Transcript_82140/g.238149 Transcript_82140/m.238149 type:complete len:229 (-) Transcript_82140:1287-1973(-)
MTLDHPYGRRYSRGSACDALVKGVSLIVKVTLPRPPYQEAVQFLDRIAGHGDLLIHPLHVAREAGQVLRLRGAAEGDQTSRRLGGRHFPDAVGVDEMEHIPKGCHVNAKLLEILRYSLLPHDLVEPASIELGAIAVRGKVPHLGSQDLRQQSRILRLALELLGLWADRRLPDEVDDDGGDDVQHAEHGEEHVPDPDVAPHRARRRERRGEGAPIGAGDSAEERGGCAP